MMSTVIKPDLMLSFKKPGPSSQPRASLGRLERSELPMWPPTITKFMYLIP